MSRRKRKNPANIGKKKAKPQRVSLRHMSLMALDATRMEKREEDRQVIISMIADGKLEPEEIENYNYISGLAKELDWSVGRTNKAIKAAQLREEMRKRNDNSKQES